jgi:hypothetical protein
VAYILRPLADGWQAVYEGVIEGLRDKNSQSEAKAQLLNFALDILTKSVRKDTLPKLHYSYSVRTLVSDLWKCNNEDYQQIARQFVERFSNRRQITTIFLAQPIDSDQQLT